MGAVVMMQAHADAMALIDELRKRGALEIEVPMVCSGEVRSLRAKFGGPDPALAPVAPRPKPQSEAEEAAEYERTLLGSAKP